MHLDLLSIPQSGGKNVVVSHIQRIGCQPEKNYFTRWPISLARGLLNRKKKKKKKSGSKGARSIPSISKRKSWLAESQKK